MQDGSGLVGLIIVEFPGLGGAFSRLMRQVLLGLSVRSPDLASRRSFSVLVFLLDLATVREAQSLRGALISRYRLS